jgi:hypothetical protein
MTTDPCDKMAAAMPERPPSERRAGVGDGGGQAAGCGSTSERGAKSVAEQRARRQRAEAPAIARQAGGASPLHKFAEKSLL